MFIKKRKPGLIFEGLLILIALVLPMAVKAADSYEEYIEEAWTTDVPYTGMTYYHRSEYEERELFLGVDVSWWQGIGGKNSTESDVNWKKLHEEGIDFALVRVASRDRADGSIYEDTCADSHIQGALENDINVGIYIFSQALTKAEAEEEASYVLELLYAHDWDITLPIVIDRENGSYKRLTAGKLTRKKETDICLAFAEVIADAGYTPMVYANANWSCKYFDTDRLRKNGCKIWLARYNDRTDEPVASAKLTYEDIASVDYDFWQYSESGKIPGYSGRLDQDFWYLDTGVPTEDLEMIENTTSSISFSWTPVLGARDYQLCRYDEEQEKYVVVQTATGTYCEDTGLMPGETYQYKLRCHWQIGGTDHYGDYSEVVTAVTLPDRVSEIAAEAQTVNSISLSWGEVYGADGYRVYHYSSDEGKYVKLMDVLDGSLSCEIEGLTAAKEYGFRVRAFRDFEGTRYWGKQSADFCAVTNPAQAKNFVVQTVSAKAVELEWSKVARASGYQICRRNEDTGEYEELAVIGNRNILSYTDNSLKGAKKYSYRVRAYLSYDGTDYYGEFSPEAEGMTKPAKVKNLALKTKSSAITLTWDKTARAGGYQIYRLDTKTGKYVKIATVKGNQTFSYKDAGLKKGTAYTYKVRAYKTYNGTTYYGSYSDVVKLTAK